MSIQQSNAAELGRFIAETSSRELPAAVTNAARLCLSDWMAVAIGAGNEAAGAVVRKQVSLMNSQGRASVLYGGTATPALAALANGTLAHCLDFDDTHIGATTHTSAPVWAATLALGEELGADENQMLRAFVTGFEIAARVGKGLGQAVTARGLHATGIFGRIGAAAASAALLGLDADRAVHALAAAATQASGLTASFGTMAKPFHAGKAAMDGILSAQLAQQGFAAQPSVLEPGGGLDKAVVQDGALALVPADFSDWEILKNSFKPYAACHLTHPAIDAGLAMGISPEQVKSAKADICDLAQQITGNTDGRPDSPLAAKFDIKYCTALALAGRKLSASDFEEPWTIDPAIAEVASRIETVGDASVDYAAATLAVEMLDGQTKRITVDVAKGHPGNPIDWDDMRSKFDGLVDRRVGNNADRLFGELRDFGNTGRLAEVRSVLGALSAPT